MSRLRNPFRLRASEKIGSDINFLRLYSPIVLEALSDKFNNGRLWNNVLYIHSSPGAGKTSLLRVFEPNSLNTLWNNRSAVDYKPLYNSLSKLDVFNDEGVGILGVTLVCTRNYDLLEELTIPNPQKIRYFFSLINSRVFLATLKSIVDLKFQNSSFKDALQSIEYVYEDKDNYFVGLDTPCTGQDLYDWASDIEKNVYKAVDSFLPAENLKVIGHNELFSLSVLKPDYFLISGKPLAANFLFMFDDAHKLSNNQRNSFRKYIIERRGNSSIWVSERLEALESIENLRSYENRDYEVLNLEKFWSENTSKFEKILANISDKRAANSSEEVNSFREFLNDELEEERHKDELLASVDEVKKNISQITAFTNKFNNWIKYVEQQDGSPLDKAILYKKLEILIFRNVGKSQLTFEFLLTEQELIEKFKSDIEAISKFFLSSRSKIPFYYGFSSLVKLSSNNIEQFLSFSADIFEQMLSNRLAGYHVNVETKEQQWILQKAAERKWNELTKVVPFPKQVVLFLSKLGEYCQKETFRPSAPYSSGVTGFAIKSNPTIFDRKRQWFEDEVYSQLVNVISTLVAFNLVEIKEVFQGKKGEKWDVYYLNRWLCLKFHLPFSYGGWRHKNADELLKWIKV